MLSVCAIDGSYFQSANCPASFEFYGRTDSEMQALGHASANGQVLRTGIGPPFSLSDLVAGRRRVGPAQLSILKHSPGEMLCFELVEGLAIQRNKTARNNRHQVERLFHTRLMGKEVFYAGNFVSGDVNEKDIGQVWRSGLAQ